MRLIAFLRAINVGGHVVRMDRLRALFEALGLERVETFIASGNVVFDAPAGDMAALEQRIEHQLRDALGYEVATFLRTVDELRTVAAFETFDAVGDDDVAAGIRQYVGFCKGVPDDEARRQLASLSTPTDEFHVEGRELYWRCRTLSSESKFSGAVAEKLLRAPATFRNMTTVRKMAERFA